MKKISYAFMMLWALLLTGTATAQTTVTASWPFKEGAGNASSAIVSAENVFSLTTFTVGSNLQQKATQAAGSVTFSLFQPLETMSAPSAEGNDNVSFIVSPKKGLTFSPSKISFKATKFGTSGCYIDLAYKVGDSPAVSLATKSAIQRNSETPAYTEFTYDLSGIDITSGNFSIQISVYGLNNGKTMGLSDILLEGSYSGSVIQVPSYTLSTALSDEQAGSITTNPSAEKYDEGTEITLTANENFGFHFIKWVNENQETVSEENPYRFSIAANTILTAVYSKSNVYSLSVALSEGANSNLVTIYPEGTIIEGVRYYEENSEVSVTATDNTILSFTNWENNSTAKGRVITMDADKSLKANFSACDYIVGWDFYQDSPKSSRAGDYKRDSENAGLLTLRNSAKESSWLAKGVSAGLYNGRYCAVNWNPFRVGAKDNAEIVAESDIFYYEISFATSGFENVKVVASMGCNYNAFEVQSVEFSLDGINYTQVSTISLPDAKSWVSATTALPAECNDQTKVYVRFRPDMTSTVKGTISGNDGTCITNVFVLADLLGGADTEAPVLISTLPAANDSNISASGSIILSFNERVQAGEGVCTLSGEALSATFSGKTVVLPYSALDYNTTYSVNIPAGAITDRYGNAFAGTSFSFTTMQRQQASARIFDAVVGSDADCDFASVQAAIDAAPENQIRPYLIFIKEGTYKEHINIPATKPYLNIIGQDVEKVKITDNRLCGAQEGYTTYHVSEGSTVVVNAANIFFENITFENSWGVEKNNGPQALALYTNNDRIILNNCKLLSYQDTYLTSTKSVSDRHYLKNCLIEGAVDFIYGAGDVFFDRCTINIVRPSGGYIVAPNHQASTKWGYVFMNNTITTDRVADPSSYSIWLGRPWHNSPKTVFINTTSEITIPAAGWYQTMGGIPALWAEYNTMDRNGNPVDLTNRNTYYYYTDDSGKKVDGYSRTAVLTADEAADYTIKNVLTGNDAWQPALVTEACKAPVIKIGNGKVVWDAVDYAISYVVCCDGKISGFTTDTNISYSEGTTVTIQAVNEFGGLSKASNAVTDTHNTEITAPEATIKAVKYFTAEGIELNAPQQGINIVTYLMSDNSTKTKKLIIK